MAGHSRKVARRTLVGTLGVVVFGLVVLVGSSHAAPLMGYQVFIVRGGSMAPTIPLGSVVAAREVRPADVHVGDVVTMRMPNGVVVTHRVVRIADNPDGTFIETQGDANEHADPSLVPISSVVGVVDKFVPVAGYLLAMMSIPSGLVSIVSMLFALLIGVWIIDDQAAEERAARRQKAPGSAGMREATA
jgi:signal peptidase I